MERRCDQKAEGPARIARGRSPRRTTAAGSGGEAFPILTGHRAVGSPYPAAASPVRSATRRRMPRAGPAAGSFCVSRLAQQLRQLGDVGGDAPGLKRSQAKSPGPARSLGS
jgi:hypothetical protein